MRLATVSSLGLYCALLVLTSCGGYDFPVQPTSNKKNTASSKTDAILAMEEKDYDEQFDYDPSGLRDPFLPLIQEAREIKKDSPSTQRGPLEPLQNFDVSKIKLIGVILGMSESKAIVVAPDGKSYIVKVGTKIGRNNGIVSNLDSDGVHVSEIYQDFAGKSQTNVRSIELPKREGVN